jgi:hypothetical protein
VPVESTIGENARKAGTIKTAVVFIVDLQFTKWLCNMTEWKSGMLHHFVWAGMGQEEVKARMQLAKLNGLNGLNGEWKGKEVRRGDAKGKERGGVEGRRRTSSNG